VAVPHDQRKDLPTQQVEVVSRDQPSAMFRSHLARAPRFGVDETAQRILRAIKTSPQDAIADPAKAWNVDVGIAGEGNPFGLPPLAAITPSRTTGSGACFGYFSDPAWDAWQAIGDRIGGHRLSSFAERRYRPVRRPEIVAATLTPRYHPVDFVFRMLSSVSLVSCLPSCENGSTTVVFPP